MTAAFSQILFTRFFLQAPPARRDLTVFPELSENSASIKAAVASEWPSRSSTLRIAFTIFLKVFISETEYDLRVRGGVSAQTRVRTSSNTATHFGWGAAFGAEFEEALEALETLDGVLAEEAAGDCDRSIT